MARRVITDDQRRESRKSLMQGCLIGCVTGLALCVLVAGIFLYRLLALPAPPREETQRRQAAQRAATLPPPPAPLEQQIQEIQRASESHMQVPVRLVADQDEINARLQQELAKHPTREFSNVAVHFGEETIAVTADCTWRGLTLHLTVRGKPVVEDGAVRIKVTETRAGDIGAPEAARKELQRRIDQALAKQWPGIHVNRVSVTPGRLTVEGYSVPQ